LEVTGTPLLLLLGTLLAELALLVAEAGGLLEVLCVDRRLLLAADVGDALVDLTQTLRGGHALDAHAGAGLIDEVDGLVREETVVDVAVGQVRGGGEGTVGDGHAVVRLVAVAQTLEDLDGQLDGGLRDLHRLETTLESGVLLDVLAV